MKELYNYLFAIIDILRPLAPVLLILISVSLVLFIFRFASYMFGPIVKVPKQKNIFVEKTNCSEFLSCPSFTFDESSNFSDSFCEEYWGLFEI